MMNSLSLFEDCPNDRLSGLAGHTEDQVSFLYAARRGLAYNPALATAPQDARTPLSKKSSSNDTWA
ncbi:hypothetical protein GCM10010405_27680 [Streptomyces macrosporus]|uniref:Uncharacterized protein n=1 Tax=Streptomyces macrosporus TaxID=44032 RepID=A0ABN3JWP2_9ACTN